MLEQDGIPTVIVAIRAFQDLLVAMSPPRLLITRHLMGRPLGAPGDRSMQREVLLKALRLLERAENGGEMALFTPGRDQSRQARTLLDD